MAIGEPELPWPTPPKWVCISTTSLMPSVEMMRPRNRLRARIVSIANSSPYRKQPLSDFGPPSIDRRAYRPYLTSACFFVVHCLTTAGFHGVSTSSLPWTIGMIRTESASSQSDLLSVHPADQPTEQEARRPYGNLRSQRVHDGRCGAYLERRELRRSVGAPRALSLSLSPQCHCLDTRPFLSLSLSLSLRRL